MAQFRGIQVQFSSSFCVVCLPLCTAAALLIVCEQGCNACVTQQLAKRRRSLYSLTPSCPLPISTQEFRGPKLWSSSSQQHAVQCSTFNSMCWPVLKEVASFSVRFPTKKPTHLHKTKIDQREETEDKPPRSQPHTRQLALPQHSLRAVCTKTQ